MKTSFKLIVLFLATFLSIPFAHAEEIKLIKMGETFNAPIRINGALTMSFMIDTGADDVGLTDDVLRRLLEKGVLDQADIRGSATYKLADGSSIKCRRLVLRRIQIGNREVSDVEASSCPGKETLLLGQSVLKKLGSWTMDYSRKVLVIPGGGNVVAESPTYTKNDIEYYQEAGAEKDPNAYYNLAVAYANGIGVRKDTNKAIAFLKRSAEMGYSQAQIDLGLRYAEGNGVPKDHAKAVELYRKAAEQGNAIGLYDLGVMHAEGKGVPKDDAKAVELYKKSAEQGNSLAQYNLGVAYAEGKGVPKDDAKAVELYKRSAEQGNALAQNNLGWMYENGWGVQKDLNKAIELYKKAAFQGCSHATQNLQRLQVRY